MRLREVGLQLGFRTDPFLLCLLLQRYTFWSNSQHPDSYFCQGDDCACYCKDTHFEAIHNEMQSCPRLLLIVLATAKIHILKQFTTSSNGGRYPYSLCLLLQRYTFWSNSQQLISRFMTSPIVLATAKIHILKQFTTSLVNHFKPVKLCLLLQRYTFWSNSQQ